MIMSEESFYKLNWLNIIMSSAPTALLSSERLKLLINYFYENNRAKFSQAFIALSKDRFYPDQTLVVTTAI